MNILAAVNEAYLEPLKVMLYSLAKSNNYHIEVYILHFCIPDKAQKDFIKQMSRRTERMKFHFIQVDKEHFEGIAHTERFGMETNLRLALLKVLPTDIERIMWLDADVIVKRDISRFYNYPDRGQCAVVCEDMFTHSEKYECLSALGMQYNERYFNAGVILFYVKNMKHYFSDFVFLQWAQDNPDKLKYQDQNVLNVHLKKKVSWAKSDIYNFQLSRAEADYKSKMKYARIIHYNTKQKPWQDFYTGKGELVYWMYAVRVLGVKKFLKHYYRNIIKRSQHDNC